MPRRTEANKVKPIVTLFALKELYSSRYKVKRNQTEYGNFAEPRRKRSEFGGHKVTGL